MTPNPVRVATEAALWGAVNAHGFLCDAVVVSDDAGQFDIGQHALCWVHAERLVHKLEPVTDHQRRAQQHVRGLIWWFYADLKAYRIDPTPRRSRELRARFDRIFRRHTGFATLDRLLKRLHANKAELLMVLDHPEIPLHTNGSENDIRCQVTKRAVSGGTHTETGRDWPRWVPRSTPKRIIDLEGRHPTRAVAELHRRKAAVEIRSGVGRLQRADRGRSRRNTSSRSSGAARTTATTPRRPAPQPGSQGWRGCRSSRPRRRRRRCC